MKDTHVGRRASGGADARVTPVVLHDAGSSDIDLTGIDPVHWAEARERVVILRAWCENGRHPRSEAVAAAARMGVTVSHFYRLVAVWKKHREARLVSGHAYRRGDQPGVPSEPGGARAIMSRIIEERGPEARFTDVREHVRAECAAAGVAAPSSGLVHKAMMRARQTPAASAVEKVEDVALAMLDCLLPLTVEKATNAVPNLILAVERPSGVIVGHRLVVEGDPVAAARELLTRIATQHGGRITVAATLAGAVRHGTSDSGGEGTTTDAPHLRDTRIEVVRRSTLLSTTLGSQIHSIPIRHRSHSARRAGPWKPMSTIDAVTAVDLAIAAHNALRRS